MCLEGVELVYAHRPQPPALQQVNLVLEPAQVTALVGLSGSGKSSLVALLQRLYDPTAGRVCAAPPLFSPLKPAPQGAPAHLAA